MKEAARSVKKVAQATPESRSQGRLLQRKCACGGKPGFDGECAECRRRRLVGLQPKPVMDTPGDRWEREADRVAEAITRAQSAKRPSEAATFPSITAVSAAALQRQESPAPGALAGSEAAAGDMDLVASLRGYGHPLDGASRRFFEPRFGKDFSDVRIHSGGRAAELTEAVGARAFTVGHHIVLGAGEYAPNTFEGRRLIAHELVHTLQQGSLSGGPGTLLQRAPKEQCGAHFLFEFDAVINDERSVRGVPRVYKTAPAGKSVEPLVAGTKLPAGQRSPDRFWRSVCHKPQEAPTQILWVLNEYVSKAEPPKQPKAKRKEERAARAATTRAEAASVAAGILSAEEYEQMRCVVRRGGCTHGLSRAAGVPEPKEIEHYNEQCRKVDKTGYTGLGVTPTEEQCQATRDAQGLNLLAPSRLADLRQLLSQYSRLIVRNALTDEEIRDIDAAIARANRQLEVLQPGLEGVEPPAPKHDVAPWVVVAEKGDVPAPTELGAFAGAEISVLAYSTAARQAALLGARVMPGLLLAAGLAAVAYVIAEYQLREKSASVVNALIGALIAALQRLAEASVEPKVEDVPKALPKEQPGPKGKKPTVQPPIPKYIHVPCPYPTGLTESDAIPFLWFKVREDDYYPRVLHIQGLRYGRDDPTNPRSLPRGEPLGVSDDFWPKPGKTVALLPEKRDPKRVQFRAVLKRYGFDWGGLQADHVQDLQWEGPDAFENLWPMDMGANMRAGGRQNNEQRVTFCETRRGPARVNVSLLRLKQEGRFFGRWFVISKVQRVER